MSDRAKSTPTCKPQTTLHGIILLKSVETLAATDRRRSTERNEEENIVKGSLGV